MEEMCQTVCKKYYAPPELCKRMIYRIVKNFNLQVGGEKDNR
jgi:hypothetical protein